MTEPLIDLDAAKRETAHPDGIPVRLGGEDFVLPAELPAEVIDPFLSDDLDLVGLLKSALEGKGDTDQIGEFVVEMLMARPTLPRELIAAIKAAFAVLFGDEQYATFVAKRPSINDYLRLAKGLTRLYGVSLGEASASPASSESAGATQKPTSSTSTESTPEGSGDAPETPGS